MNSADKKPLEPSMDDIISSIRNIIADDSQETVPAPITPAAENQSPAIVQLTENQIAESVNGQTNGVSVAPDMMAPATAPQAAINAEPAIAQSTPDLDIASEIDAVPGLMTPPEAPVNTSAPDMSSPALNVSEPLAPASTVHAAQVNGVMAIPSQEVAPAPGLIPAPAANEIPPTTEPPSAPQLNVQEPAVSPSIEQPAAIIEDDIAFVSPEDTPNSPADTGLAPIASTAPQANDPVEEMMQSVNTDKTDSDTVNNGVDPEQILEGMEAAPSEEIAATAAAEAPPVAPAPVIEPAPSLDPVAEQTPVILDASKVTPEDAEAITAVATATNQAMSYTGTSSPMAHSLQEQTGNSIEDIVRALLKPMIREWLDDNMPRILQGVIKEEIGGPENDKT